MKTVFVLEKYLVLRQVLSRQTHFSLWKSLWEWG